MDVSTFWGNFYIMKGFSTLENIIYVKKEERFQILRLKAFFMKIILYF